MQATPARPGRPGVARWLIAVAVATGVVLTATLATVGGVIAYRVARAPVPSPPPPGHYLPAASEAGIEQAASAQGLRCGSPPLIIGAGRAPRIRTCQRTSATRSVSVQTIAFDTNHVEAVEADVVAGRPADESAAIAFLQSIIDAAVGGDDAATAGAWLRAHFDQSGTSRTVVNGVALRLVVNGPVRSLVVTPAG